LTYVLKTLTLAISLEWYLLGLHYFTWVFLVTIPSHGCQLIWPCDLDHGVWPTYWKLYFWIYLLNGMNPNFNIWRKCSLYNSFDLVTLTLVFDLLIENYNLYYIFWIAFTSWHFIWVFFVTKPFLEYQRIWPCFPNFGVWTYLLKFKLWLYFLNGMYKDLYTSFVCSILR
jgi:hypothetical protein